MKMMKVLRKACCVLMTLVTLLVTICPAMAVEKTMQGHFGSDLIWLFTPGNSTMTVKGKGEIPARGSDTKEFEAVLPRVRIVVIGEGVTAIGSAAFEGCAALEKIVLPQSLVRIGADAFAGAAVTEITIPENVTYIGGCAFARCGNLRAVTYAGRHPVEAASSAFAETPLLCGNA